MAFQLQDDLLDVYGDPEIFGKKIGGDIVAGKKTYLLVKTMELADRNSRAKLVQVLENTQLEKEEKIIQVRHIYDQTGIREMVLKKIFEYFHAANEAMNRIDVTEERKAELIKLAHSLLDRKK